MRFHHDGASHIGIHLKEVRHLYKTKNAEKGYEIYEIVIFFCQFITSALMQFFNVSNNRISSKYCSYIFKISVFKFVKDYVISIVDIDLNDVFEAIICSYLLEIFY